MLTIVESKDYIDRLWGKQQVRRSGKPYRLMKYVFRVDYNKTILLFNVVSGQLVALDNQEAEILGRLPSSYSSGMDSLILNHFLVPDDYNEHEQVIRLRYILRKLDFTQSKEAIIHYTILPTTACNARCYYCFEQGLKPVTMTESTANEVIDFISSHCGNEKSISISWFGGEPTLAANRIDQICSGLNNNNIYFRSQMISNGYLFDEHLVERAKKLWNLVSVQISVDGIEENYNTIKAYSNVKGNPYERVMRNVKLLLDKGIYVNLRMNFDVNNFSDFEKLVDESVVRYKGNKFFNIRAHPINGEYKNKDGIVLHGTDEWFSEKVVALNDIANKAGLFLNKKELLCMRFNGCMAANDSSITITPEGHLVNCPEHTEKEQYIGNIKEGITQYSIKNSWKEISDYYKCHDCVLFPYCLRVINCSAKDRCNYLLLYTQQLSKSIKEEYNNVAAIRED